MDKTLVAVVTWHPRFADSMSMAAQCRGKMLRRLASATGMSVVDATR